MTVGDYDVKYNQEKNKYEATEKGSSSSTIVYRWSEDLINIDDTIDPNDTSKFTKNASTLGKDAYLKYVLDKDNKIIELYACAIFNNTEYCVKGADPSSYGWSENEANYTGNMLIFKELQGKGFDCKLSNSDSICEDGSIGLSAHYNGDLDVVDKDGGCSVNQNGSSLCG